jgi:hypothetical protein
VRVGLREYEVVAEVEYLELEEVVVLGFFVVWEGALLPLLL